MRFHSTVAANRPQPSAFAKNEPTDLHGEQAHDAARPYARRGWLVFPCTPGGKKPAIRRGFHGATTNPATIDRWWHARPDYNVAIRCGAGSRLWVIDVDCGGSETIDRLIAEHGPLPQTLTVETAAGRHLYFATTLDLPTTAGKIGPGIDTRGRGGYVLALPSLHPTGAIYRWETKFEPSAPPQWLMNPACRSCDRPAPLSAAPSSSSGNDNLYGKAA